MVARMEDGLAAAFPSMSTDVQYLANVICVLFMGYNSASAYAIGALDDDAPIK